MKKVAFIDRDGTLIVGPRMLCDNPPMYDEIIRVEQLTILPGVYEGLQALSDAGYTLVMVTNQEGLGSERFPKFGFDAVQREFLRRLALGNIRFDNIFVCPHLEADACACRKPKTGLVDAYVLQNDIDLNASIVIGDRDTDAGFAKRIGLRFLRADADARFPYDDIQTFISSSSSS